MIQDVDWRRSHRIQSIIFHVASQMRSSISLGGVPDVMQDLSWWYIGSDPGSPGVTESIQASPLWHQGSDPGIRLAEFRIGSRICPCGISDQIQDLAWRSPGSDPGSLLVVFRIRSGIMRGAVTDPIQASLLWHHYNVK